MTWGLRRKRFLSIVHRLVFCDSALHRFQLCDALFVHIMGGVSAFDFRITASAEAQRDHGSASLAFLFGAPALVIAEGRLQACAFAQAYISRSTADSLLRFIEQTRSNVSARPNLQSS